MTIETDGLIPRAIGAVQEPSPARVESNQYPCRYAESARKVCDSGVNGDHQIKLCYQSGSVVKVLEFIGKVVNAGLFPQRRALFSKLRLCWVTFLKADPFNALTIKVFGD